MKWYNEWKLDFNFCLRSYDFLRRAMQAVLSIIATSLYRLYVHKKLSTVAIRILSPFFLLGREGAGLKKMGITLFTLFHNPTELRQKTVNQKSEKKSAILKGNRTQDPSVMVQCSTDYATDYATAASSLDSLLLYLINVTNEISCI